MENSLNVVKKSRKIILIDKENFESSITHILKNSDIEFLIFLVFKNNLEENLSMLEELKGYFLNRKKSDYLNNTVVFSEREYMANDLEVRAVITVEKISAFDIDRFNEIYEKLDISKESTNEFFIKNSIPFRYKIDLYNDVDPWLTSINGVGVLTISEKTYDKIMCNYHKVRNLCPDITIITLKGKDDSKSLGLLKMIGADAHITLGITSVKNIEYTKRLDALIYNRSPYSENNIKKFVREILREKKFKNSLYEFRDFLGIAPKNFEADIFYDEEEELNKKEEKFFKLKVTLNNKLKPPKIEVDDNSISLYRTTEKNKSEVYFFEKIEK